jgi:cysteine desulfurase
MSVVYFDHNATTPLLPEVARAMAECQAECFANPASQHQLGRRSRQALEQAREATGEILGAQMSGRQADRVIFTSGGTEANNLALLGFAGVETTPGDAIISAIEHPSVSAPAEELERRGWTVHRLGVTPDGVVDVAALDALLSKKTRFVSVMLANNETGVLQPVAEIATRCAALGVPVHTDAAQAIGKVPVDFRALGVAAMTVAAHKFHGPLGVGALIVRDEAQLAPQLYGGAQQAGMRPGTEATALAVGLHAALAAWLREARQRNERMQTQRDRLEASLAAHFAGGVAIHGQRAPRLPSTSNVALLGLDRQALLMALDLAGVACSTGSACASGSSEPSRVLAAMGCSGPALLGALRFSLGATTTSDDVDAAIERIVSVGHRLLERRSRPAPSG